MTEPNASCLNFDQPEKQTYSHQQDINGHVCSVENESETAENQLERQFQEPQNESNFPRRSERTHKPTEKMLSFQKEEVHKRERKFVSMYNQWKVQARDARQQLKSDISESQLTVLVDDLEKARNDVTCIYEEIRHYTAPSPEIRRQVDACMSVTGDITKIIYERITGVDGEFDADRVRNHLHTLLDCDHAHSIYGSTVSRVSHKSSTRSSHHSMTSCLSAKCAEAAADVAAKEAVYELLLEENKQKEKIQHLEEQHKRALEAQKRELDRLQAVKDLKAAQARLGVYSQEVECKTNSSVACEPKKEHNMNQTSFQQSSNVIATAPQTDMSCLAQAFQESITLNRLPVPEPFVFSGDPIQFVEWKNSFMSLIDRKSISFADKLYYLKKYVGGPARKTLDGIFYRNDTDAYQDAWKRLDHRYGQPFVIQKAFRERLANWPKIQYKDAIGLREFSDFLNACLDAMPHVKGLQILNDCEENQKLVQKLPDWAASRWNRQVTQTLNQSQEFPTFQEFATFVSMEAEVACNPITSTYALRATEPAPEKRTNREVRRNKASVFSTQTNTDNERIAKSSFKQICMLCQDNKHLLSNCSAFTAKSLEERRKIVREKKLCYGCLKPGHSARDCRHRLLCSTCKGKHPTCLHDSAYVKREKSASPMASAHTSETVKAVALNVAREENSISTSMIVPVWVSSKNSPSSEKLVYALLDTQSDTTFIEQAVSDDLQADTYPVKLKLTTMIGKDTVLKSERVSGLCIRGYSSAVHIDLPPVYTKNCIPVNRSHIPTSDTAKHWKHLAAIVDEIPPLKDCEVGLLIGYNCPRALAPRKVIVGGAEEPYAVQTDLGWSIVGCSMPCLELSKPSSMCHRVAVRELPPVTPADAVRILESDFKDIDGASRRVSQDDILFLNKLKEGIRKNAQGHYEMPLPFKERPVLPCNRQPAMIRLSHLKRKLLRDETHKKHYVMSMNEVIKRGDAEEVKDDGMKGEKWYIPHHGVYHPKKPDKLRVVFDCSARYEGTSLNDHLLSGPDLINNLIGILIRFRQHPIALMCDIEKMFHQFHVNQSDRDYLRFLWWENGELSAQPREFRMKVHLFGATSSPGCANYGMKHLASENNDLYPLGANFVMKDFYVDDGITSVDSTENAIKLAKEARELCALGGLRLHKFVSNSEAVLESIPSSERAKDLKELDLAFGDLPLERALGIQWHTQSDCFKFKIELKTQPATRRGILSTVASLYDPLGFVAPFVLNGKRILQEMCRHGTGWDDPLKDELQPRWERWKSDLNNLDKIDISRSYAPVSFGKIVRVELHHFSDASSSGYGQCSYLRLSNEAGDVHCALVTGKSRVTPTKLTTIPRLELTAAVVSVKVSNVLKEELGYANVQEFFWTDSKVVLGYINNEARRFHTFVANRVQRIHLSTTSQQWKYVPTTENPADHASRGLTVSELLSSNWFRGPEFLWKKDIVLPSEVIPELPIGDPEIKVVHTLNTEAAEQFSLIDRLSNFSSWQRATQAIARILRRINKDKSNSLTTVTERENAQRIIIKTLQGQVYQSELKRISKGTPLPSHHEFHSLNAFIDKDGVLKVGGRLHDSSLSNSFKHPAIIPKNHPITKMIISHYHEKVQHQGKGLTINEIRSNGFWIPGINRSVASFIHKCVTCRKQRRPTEEQKMADLPPERLEPSLPFTYCGMDCFGPLLTKQGRNIHKRYGLLFTCFCSRAVHLEMLTDMSTDAFINGLRCFIAIRGTVRQIKSDQGSNFVGAKNELKKALNEIDTERLATFLAQKQCDFCMNAPHSSHAGGVWERQIRTIKAVLNTTLSLSPGRLDDSSLRTFLYEAMAIVNNRPLTVDNLSDPNSLEPITPNHLLTLKRTTPLPPPGTFVKEDMYARKRWRHVQYLTEQFWGRWRKEYVANIATRQRWHVPKRNLQIGDVVMVKEDNLPRNEWRLGRVLETTTAKDGLVRRVKIQLGDQKLSKNGMRLSTPSIVERPIQKLVLLLETE